MNRESRAKSVASLLACASVALWLCAHPDAATALEERIEDLSASVEVASVFSINLSTANLTFNNISPGKTLILGEGHWFNEIRCRSNSGQPWYLKAQVVSLKHVQGAYELPAAALQWKVADSTGSGEPMGGRSAFHEFSEQPALIYASQGDDNRGREVVLRFQYSLLTPLDALAGNYIGQIIFTMVETP